jgi:flagellar biogenesis protein FliO
LREYSTTHNLDFWDGKNWTCGSTGRHLGLTRLRKSGQYVLIHGTDFQGEQDRAEIVTDEEAYRAIISSGNIELLEKFPDLQRFEEDIDTDEDPDESKTTIQISKTLKKQLSDMKNSPDETYQDVIGRLVMK